MKFTEMEAYRWTVDLYNHITDAGILTPNDRVELLEGRIIEKGAINEPHAACVDVLHENLALPGGGVFCESV